MTRSTKMLEVDYNREGFHVMARLIENSQRKNPPVTLLEVYIRVDALLDPEAHKTLHGTVHILSYEKANTQLEGQWQLLNSIWPNQPRITAIATPALCVFDAVERFELHERQHFLKVNGELVINPHKEV